MAKKQQQMSFLEKGQTIEGKFSCKGDLAINGTVKGIFSGENVSIGPEGAIYADAEADNLEIAGRFEGNLKVTKVLNILSTGVCIGKVECRDLIVSLGGVLNAGVSSSRIQQTEALEAPPFSDGMPAHKPNKKDSNKGK